MPHPDYFPPIYGEPVIPDSMVFIAITMKDPVVPVAIMGFNTVRRDAGDGDLYIYPATPENIEAEIKKSRFEATSWRIIRYEDIPKDRTYRDALKDDGKSLKHDMERAREIHKGHIRLCRQDMLAALDIEYQKADEKADAKEKKRIAKEKQRLRDATDHPDIETAETTEELKAVWPLDK